ncbi:MAG: hypothetical protein QOH46_3903 [Solirubrobacteraceae bacterium]|nr:hypothetical protein [Solirubrobacteraceae bacterium]
MAADPLTVRQLNRATLARQMLLARERVGVVDAVERLGGLQAQEAKPAFVALWARLEGFEREQLRRALHDREVVRALLMRATLHIVSAADHAALRGALRPVMTGALRALRGRDEGLDIDALLPVARKLAAEQPRTFGELRPLLSEAFPGVNARALGYAVRTHLPLVMVPTGDAWAFPSDAAFAPADTWLDAPAEVDDGAATLVRRHLAAFGPASAADVQAWSGLTGLKAVLEGMADDLVTFRDERGGTLYDLPDAPRPDADIAAPPRLLPEFDSLVLAHDDRSRVVADEHRGKLVTKNLRVRATFLVDGFVAGTWTVTRKGKKATLTLTPFARLPRGVRAPLTEEAEALLRFTEGADAAVDVKVGPVGD